MRAIEIVTEILAAKLSPNLSYDPSQHRLKDHPKPSLQMADGKLKAVPGPPPKLTLRHLNKIKNLRRLFLKQRKKTLADISQIAFVS